MLISRSSHPKKFIFYHTYKCGGSSIRRALYSACSKKQVVLQYLNQIPRKFHLPYPIAAPIYQYHPKLKDVRNYLGDQYDHYFVFTFVRNPISIQLSLYKYMYSNRRHRQHNLIKKFSFDEYMVWRMRQDRVLITDFHRGFDGSILVSKFYKLEHIQEQFSDLMHSLKIVNYSLPFVNQSQYRPSLTYLSSNVYDQFVTEYESDFSLLNYDPYNVPSEIKIV